MNAAAMDPVIYKEIPVYHTKRKYVVKRSPDLERRLQENDWKLREQERQRQLQEYDRKLKEQERKLQDNERKLKESERKMQVNERKMKENERKVQESKHRSVDDPIEMPKDVKKVTQKVPVAKPIKATTPTPTYEPYESVIQNVKYVPVGEFQNVKKVIGSAPSPSIETVHSIICVDDISSSSEEIGLPKSMELSKSTVLKSTSKSRSASVINVQMEPVTTSIVKVEETPRPRKRGRVHKKRILKAHSRRYHPEAVDLHVTGQFNQQPDHIGVLPIYDQPVDEPVVHKPRKGMCHKDIAPRPRRIKTVTPREINNSNSPTYPMTRSGVE